MTMAVRISAWARLLAHRRSSDAMQPSGISGGRDVPNRPAAKINRLTALLASTSPKINRTRFLLSIRNTLPATIAPVNMANTVSISTFLQVQYEGQNGPQDDQKYPHIENQRRAHGRRRRQ